MNLIAIADLLCMIADEHHLLAGMYEELAMHCDPSLADYEATVMAQAIQGEEAGKFGDKREQLAVWISHTAYNRWEKPWWKRIDGVDCTFATRIETDWHGAKLVSPDMVEPWARRIAYTELRNRRAGGIDLAKGALFAMTLEDLRNNGWIERARELLVHVIASPDDPRVQFWFMSDHPGKDSQDD